MNIIKKLNNTIIKTYFRECNFCSNYFRTPEKENYFCSDMCEEKSKHIIQLTCNICKRRFNALNSDEKFCSDMCEEKSKHLIKKTCIKCLKGFTTIDSEAKFCSLICEAMHKKLGKKNCKLCDKEIPFGIKSMSFCCESCKIEYGNILTKWHSMMKEGKLISLDILRENYIKEKNNLVNNYEIKKDNLPEMKKDNLPEMKKESDGTYKIKCEICEQEFQTRQINKTVCSVICREKKIKMKKNTTTNKRYTQEEQIVVEQVKYLIETALASKNIGSFNEYGFTDSLKDRVKERDDYTCQICGSGLQLEVHHIVPRRCGGLNIEENLITLCVSCHRAIETKDIERATKKCLRNYNKDDLTHQYINYEAMYIDKQIRMKSLFNNIVQTFEETEVKRKILQTLNEIIEEV